MKKKTTEEFIKDARTTHGDRYDYSLVKYINARTKIKIICPEHGIFEQKPKEHMLKKGCSRCGQEKLFASRKDTNETFIKKARDVHGDRFDYSRVEYRGASNKVMIGCPIHGVFEQTPASHLKNKGCRRCSSEELSSKFRNSKEDFLNKVKAKHGAKYDYSLVEYKNNKTKVKIICPEHGEFLQTPCAHLNHGCKECGKIEAKKTSEQKYGVSHPMKSSLVKEKTKKTLKNKYGVGNISQIDGVQNKIRETSLRKRGSPHHMSSPEVRKKIEETNLKKYGSKTPLGNKEVVLSLKGTVKEKYGSTNVMHVPEFVDKQRRKTLSAKYDDILAYEQITPLFSREEYCGTKGRAPEFSAFRYRFKCAVCDTEFEDIISSGKKPVCLHCNPASVGTSREEREVADFARSLGIELLENDRNVIKPFELDIFIPDKSFAIEYNGLYWHTSDFRDKKSHLEKTERCLQSGVKLFHLFSDEWHGKRDICESMIKNRLGLSDKRLYARKCEIREVEKKERMKFVNENHISGKTTARKAFGLYYQGKLVSLLSLGKPIQKKYGNALEIKRFCSLKGFSVIGGFSKLLKKAKEYSKEEGFESILTYADRRFGEGCTYEKAGFEILGQTALDYWYTDGIHRFNRFLHRARGRLSEEQVANEAGVKKVYGCGSNIYLLTI